MSNFNLKTETFEVDGVEFTTTQFPAMAALDVMASIQNAAPGANPNAAISQAAFAKADSGAMKKMVLDVLKCTTAILRDSNKFVQLTNQQAIDQVFSGRLRLMFKVIEKVVEVNFGDFNEGSEESAPLAQTPNQ